MELLFQLILVVVVLKYTCKASFFENIWGIVGYALMVAIVAFIIYPIVIEQPGDFYKKILSSRVFVSDIAIVITIEAVVGILISISMLKNVFTPHKTYSRWLKILPGVLIVGVIFYSEQYIFYTFTGYSFMLVALFTSLGGLLLVLLLSLSIRFLFPERAVRYELKFLLNILLLIGGILLSAGVSPYSTASYKSDFEWEKMLAFCGIVLLFTFVGFAIYRLALRNKNFKKIKKWM